MKPEIKAEGGKVFVKLAETQAVDKDQDGVASVKGSISVELELDGMEIVDELAKSSEFLAGLKAKFGA